MNVILQYTEKARNDLAKFDAVIRTRILLKLEIFCYKSKAQKHSKALTGMYQGLYRFRVGDYRAIFKKDAQGRITIITIVRIKHRRVYMSSAMS